MRYTKLYRYFQRVRYNAVERTLVALNYYQNFYIMALFVNTPLLLRLAHEARARLVARLRISSRAHCSRLFAMRCVAAQILVGSSFPVYGNVKNCRGGALLLQLVYDWYWNLRLRRSWVKCVSRTATLRAQGVFAACADGHRVPRCRFCSVVKKEASKNKKA